LADEGGNTIMDEGDSFEDASADASLIPSPQSFPKQPMNLYEKLATDIKSQLVSYRKRSPNCRICMDFDCIYFDGLVQRGSVIPRTKHLKR